MVGSDIKELEKENARIDEQLQMVVDEVVSTERLAAALQKQGFEVDNSAKLFADLLMEAQSAVMEVLRDRYRTYHPEPTGGDAAADGSHSGG